MRRRAEKETQTELGAVPAEREGRMGEGIGLGEEEDEEEGTVEEEEVVLDDEGESAA